MDTGAKRVTNRFGEGLIYSENVLYTYEQVKFISAGCLSGTSDYLSYVQNRLEKDPSGNAFEIVNNESTELYGNLAIIIYGCQVTDLAILNDIDVARRLHKEFPKSDIYMGGCLANRFDIELPDYIKRIGTIRTDYKAIEELAYDYVQWEEPYWTNAEGKDKNGKESGKLFRNSYPLKVGAGCTGKCSYCTIRDTRGEQYNTDALLQVKEFLDVKLDKFDGIVITSDSPTINQIKDWCMLAKRYKRKISFRNVEPFTLVQCDKEITSLAEAGLLDKMHCPIQSYIPEVLEAMNRTVEVTLYAINIMKKLKREYGVYTSTNVIIDYVNPVTGEYFENAKEEWLKDTFSNYEWNPYFNGLYNEKDAKKRYEKYIGQRKWVE